MNDRNIPPVPSLSLLPKASPSFSKFVRYCLDQQRSQVSSDSWPQTLAGTKMVGFPTVRPGFTPRATSVIEHEVCLLNLASTGTTAATIVQAAWCLLMGIYTEIPDNSDDSFDVVVGMTLNGRSAHVENIDDIVGPTIATVPFRILLRFYQPLVDFLMTVKDRYLSVISHEQFGLPNIRRLNDGAEAVCRFRNLLVVQSTRIASVDEHARLSKDLTVSYSSIDCALMTLMECELRHPQRRNGPGTDIFALAPRNLR